MSAGLLAVGSPASAYPRPGRTELVSVGPAGEGANAWAQHPSITPDGRFVTWWLRDEGLDRIFIHDRKLGTTELVSVNSEGIPADGHSDRYSSVSADGRFVAFGSGANNLDLQVPPENRGQWSIYLRDRIAGTTEIVSGPYANHAAQSPDISADGRFVSFVSQASNLTPEDTDGGADVFVYDRTTKALKLASVASDGSNLTTGFGPAPISADGRFVAISTDTAVYVRDLEAGATEPVSVASDGTASTNLWYQWPQISDDGRYVAFVSSDANLVPGWAINEPASREGVYIHDRVTDTTELVSVASDGTPLQVGYGASVPSISGDGRFVTFRSHLIPGSDGQLFIHDRETKATELVSVAQDGTMGNGHSWDNATSEDGRFVAFQSLATNLTPGGRPGGTYQIFVRDRGAPLGVSNLSVEREGESASVAGQATFSGNVVSTAADPAGDGAFQGRDVGADLVAASILQRPELEDVLVHLRVASMPGFPALGAGDPGIMYLAEFKLDGVSYRVRAVREAVGLPPSIELYRCDPQCVSMGDLSGAIGTTGNNVLAAIPTAMLRLEEGDTLTNIRAFTADQLTAEEIDEVDLADATLGERKVWLGIAPIGSTEGDVVFESQATLSGSTFSGVIPAPNGDRVVWARACLGTVCAQASSIVVA